MKPATIPTGFETMLSFGLVDALLGRRSRRFFLGAEIPDGVFAYQSQHQPVPLSELEKLLLVTACGGNTSWHHMIYRAQLYAPHLSNYAGLPCRHARYHPLSLRQESPGFPSPAPRRRRTGALGRGEPHPSWVCVLAPSTAESSLKAWRRKQRIAGVLARASPATASSLTAVGCRPPSRAAVQNQASLHERFYMADREGAVPAEGTADQVQRQCGGGTGWLHRP